MILAIIVGALILAGLKNAGAQAGVSQTTSKFLGVPIFDPILRRSNVAPPENNAPPWGTMETHGQFPGAPIIINPIRVGEQNNGGGGAVTVPTPAPSGGGSTPSGGAGGGAGGGGTGLTGGGSFRTTF